jgi:hypothetical protein
MQRLCWDRRSELALSFDGTPSIDGGEREDAEGGQEQQAG